MKHIRLLFFVFIGISAGAFAQQQITIDAKLLPEKYSIQIKQSVTFANTSKDTLREIKFNDWAISFATKTTPLARRFAENYDSRFHFEKKEDRGKTTLHSITSATQQSLSWQRGSAIDILEVTLPTPLPPGEKTIINLAYTVKLPDVRFTRFGATREAIFKLKYWFIAPAVYDGEWQTYSNKDVEDLFLKPTDFNVTLQLPDYYVVTSEFNTVSETTSEGKKTIKLKGEQRNRALIFLQFNSDFETIVTDKLEVVTNIQDKKVTPPVKALTVDRVVHFLNERLGDYPFERVMVTEEEYKKNPVYGLNQLPNFISPFPDGFEYDMDQLKTLTRIYLENTLPFNLRKDSWLIGALQIYLMQEYVDRYYPKMKILGTLSDFWIIEWAHAADLEFNDQYPILYLNMARNNLHQKLTTPRDSLLKFNLNIANDYYGGDGLEYLSAYLGKQVVDSTIQKFYTNFKLKQVATSDFKNLLEENTQLPVNWFFEDYIDNRTTIDFKIKKVEKEGDSLRVTVTNKRNNTMPVQLFGLNKDGVVFTKWTQPIDSTVTLTIPSENVRKLAVNYDGLIPEFNQRNNYKKVKGLLNRPLQFRLFQDVEDPKYNQLFFMPVFEYNFYDGVSLGMKLYNKTVLPKGIHYKFEPQYAIKSNTIVGSGSIQYTDIQEGNRPYSMRYGVSGNYYSYDDGLFYRRFTPYMTFAFRNDDLRDNEKQFINLRNVNVNRDEDPNDPNQDPSYSVFNFQYVYSNPNLINYFRGVVDYQISSKFSKISAEFEYRKLFLSNRQLNLRLFAGTFLFNDTRYSSDFFSFALDRPTDYLFDYNYYGRSEEAGLFSQQIIIAEGGFKSKLQPAYADSWIATINGSTNIWKWIYAYGDVGLVHNAGRGTNCVFDTGIRLSLVADYFEVFLPMYSNLGWEPGLPDYDQRIRFIVTLSPKTLLGLFTRKWY